VALGSIPAKDTREPPQLRAGRSWIWAGWPPLEPVRPLAWPTSYPPIVEPMTLVIFDYREYSQILPHEDVISSFDVPEMINQQFSWKSLELNTYSLYVV
jgi:hypothetical protein